MTLIEDAYAQLAELPVEFDRADIGRILFERAMRQLEEEKSEINQRTIHGRYYSLLSAAVMKLEAQDYKTGWNYSLVSNVAKANFSLRKRRTWTPEDL